MLDSTEGGEQADKKVASVESRLGAIRTGTQGSYVCLDWRMTARERLAGQPRAQSASSWSWATNSPHQCLWRADRASDQEEVGKG